MRKFKFIGNSKDYNWDNSPKYGSIYPGNFIGKHEKDGFESDPLEDWWHERPTEWVELQQTDVDPSFFEIDNGEVTKIPNQDQPASEMTKFEMAVLWNLKGIISNPNTAHQITAALGNNVDADTADKAVVSKAIKLGKETFKQLENLKK